jgi:hypothetical protein
MCETMVRNRIIVFYINTGPPKSHTKCFFLFVEAVEFFNFFIFILQYITKNILRLNSKLFFLKK